MRTLQKALPGMPSPQQVAMHALPVTSGRPEGDLTGPLLESHHRMRLVDALQLGDIG